MFEEYIDTISTMPLFKGIKRDNIPVMLECLKPKVHTYDKNDFIAITGEAFDRVGIVLGGEATVSKETAAGNRTIMTMLKKGDMFGEMLAFSSQTFWPATVQALEPCKVLFLPKEKIISECDRLCPWHHQLINNLLSIISDRALVLNKKVEYLSIKSMRGKLSSYLLEEYKRKGSKNITLPLKRNELADFLNVSRPSMSREICKMRDEGIIDFHLSAFRILDVEALKAMTDS